MKTWRLFLAVMLCSCLAIGIGLVGCGDDDDEGEMTCEEAVTQVNSQACQDEATGNVDGFKSCIEDCEGNEACIDVCDEQILDEIPSCLLGLLILIDDGNDIARCGDCYPPCGDDFGICIDDTPTSGTDCWEAMMNCINDCV